MTIMVLSVFLISLIRPANLLLFCDNRHFLGQLGHSCESHRTGELFLWGGCYGQDMDVYQRLSVNCEHVRT